MWCIGKLVKSEFLTNQLCSLFSLSVIIAIGPLTKGSQKGDHHRRHGLKLTKEAEFVFLALTPLCHDRAEGRRLTVCHILFWSIHIKIVSLACLIAANFWVEMHLLHVFTFNSQSPWLSPQKCIFTKVYFLDSLVVDQIIWGGGKKKRKMPIWSLLHWQTYVWSKFSVIHLLWLFVDHVCWKDKWTPQKDIYLNYPHNMPSLCVKRKMKEQTSLYTYALHLN